MKREDRVVLVDIDGVDELEYRNHVITRIEPQYYFYIISRTDESKPLSQKLAGKWTSPKEAMAAIDKAEVKPAAPKQPH